MKAEITYLPTGYWKDDKALYPELPFRKWIRSHVPSPKFGYVVEDLDLIMLNFGNAINRDYNADGRIALIELKQNNAEFKYAQQRTFSLIDRLLRIADPNKEYYRGFYLVRWKDLGNDHIDFQVNGEKLTEDQFQDFLMEKLDIEPMVFQLKSNNKPINKSIKQDNKVWNIEGSLFD